jgi:nucleoside-diphosphate-sugar epimerase
MTNLVTGATGFIGSHLIEELLSRGETVRALVRKPVRETPWLLPSVEIVEGDLCDPDAVRSAVRGTDVVYHCAAAGGENVPASVIFDANLAAQVNLLEALRQTGKGRLVSLSGLSVLGLRNFDPLTEDLPCRKSPDPDIEVKLRAEELTWNYHQHHGVEACILRAGFVYGPRDRRNLPHLLSAIRKGTFVYIGSRRNLVPLVHVSDMARVLALAGRTPAANGRVYHIADGSRTTMRDLVTHLAQLLGCPPPKWTLPYFATHATCWSCEWLGRMLGRPVRGPISRSTLLFLGTSRFVDIRRAREELGYTPEIGCREGMSAAVRCVDEESHERPEYVCPAS